MTKGLTQYVLHPFCVAAYPILYLLSLNIQQIPPTQVVRPLLISLSVALFLTILFGAAAKNLRQGGLSTTIILILFFTYGHVYNWMELNTPALARHTFLGILWLLMLVLGLILKYRIRDIGSVTKYLNLVAAVLLIQPLFNLGLFFTTSGSLKDVEPHSPFENIRPTIQTNNSLPDIYYIILDGYGRSDVVKELFEFDNSTFIEFLEERGFYVADQSHSNYIQTALSISSALNLDYLEINDGQPIVTGDRDPLAELIHHSELRKFLEGQGYQSVTFSTGYGPTTIADSDLFISSGASVVNDLEGLVLATSALRILDEHILSLFLPLLCDFQRQQVLSTFENLQKIPELPGQKFVFMHVISPHPPFVFDSNGGASQHGACNSFDGNLFNGSFEDYHTGYPQQLAYISRLVEDSVNKILAKSKTPPVIIIQGDHGSGLLLDWESSANSCLRERTAILNAYYIPEPYTDTVYESISPINSFRVVLNAIFDLQLPLLDDRSYYSAWESPYQLEDITTKIEATCKIPEQ